MHTVNRCCGCCRRELTFHCLPFFSILGHFDPCVVILYFVAFHLFSFLWLEKFQIFGSTWWLCEGPPGFWNRKMRQPRPQHQQSKMSVTVVLPFSEASDSVWWMYTRRQCLTTTGGTRLTFFHMVPLCRRVQHKQQTHSLQLRNPHGTSTAGPSACSFPLPTECSTT